MIRTLAGVYHDLTTMDEDPSKRKTDGEVTTFFAKLAPHMKAPIDENGAWRAIGVFMDSGMAPQASQGDVRKLTTEITKWADKPPTWLS